LAILNELRGHPTTESPSAETRRGALLARIAGNGVRTVIVETTARDRYGGRRASEGRKTYAEREGGQELVALARQLRGDLNGPPQSLRKVAADLAGRGERSYRRLGSARPFRGEARYSTLVRAREIFLNSAQPSRGGRQRNLQTARCAGVIHDQPSRHPIQPSPSSRCCAGTPEPDSALKRPLRLLAGPSAAPNAFITSHIENAAIPLVRTDISQACPR
jgi:hypothetical protein